MLLLLLLLLLYIHFAAEDFFLALRKLSWIVHFSIPAFFSYFLYFSFHFSFSLFWLTKVCPSSCDCNCHLVACCCCCCQLLAKIISSLCRWVRRTVRAVRAVLVLARNEIDILCRDFKLISHSLPLLFSTFAVAAACFSIQHGNSVFSFQFCLPCNSISAFVKLLKQDLLINWANYPFLFYVHISLINCFTLAYYYGCYGNTF